MAAFRFVLVAPSHAGNIGSVVRAMRTMGLDDLVVVNPQAKPTSPTIRRRARWRAAPPTCWRERGRPRPCRRRWPTASWWSR